MSVPRLFSTAHLPAFLWQSSPFMARLIREAVERLGVGGAAHVPPLSPTTANSANGAKDTTKKTPPPPHTKTADANTMLTVRPAREWLHHERMGMHLHMAHRIVEWDVWEEGLVESILGPEEAKASGSSRRARNMSMTRSRSRLRGARPWIRLREKWVARRRRQWWRAWDLGSGRASAGDGTVRRRTSLSSPMRMEMETGSRRRRLRRAGRRRASLREALRERPGTRAQAAA
ncbi:hypothetical protein B0H19DRAFT_1064586 [Mycena capillaripes]|nr:hypothetical protein B0H19DRAFT_1064586 [Mycena capillaripes]